MLQQFYQNKHRLTYGGDDGDGKVKRACEFPLHPSSVGLCLHDDGLQFSVIILTDVVFPLETLFLGFQLLFLPHLKVGLQCVKDGGPDQQVCKRANDQGQGPHVLPLHGQQEAATEGLMSPRVPREGAASVVEAERTVPGGGGGGAEQCAPLAAGVGAAVVPPRLVVTEAQILLLVDRETQETAGSPGPGALQPKDPAQDLPEPSPFGAQCH